jgi:hypothetical protein
MKKLYHIKNILEKIKYCFYLFRFDNNNFFLKS